MTDTVATGATSEESGPCVSHLALKEWDRMFDAWVKHQAGLPSDVPLWPNPEWSQDVAMVAHALAGSAPDDATAITHIPATCVWRIGGKVVSEDAGKVAMRAALKTEAQTPLPSLVNTSDGADLRKYVYLQLGFLTDDDNAPAERLLRIAAERIAAVETAKHV